MKKVKPPSADQLKRIKLYKSGKSLREIAEICGISFQAVQLTIKKFDVETRAQGSSIALKHPKEDEMIKLYTESMKTISAISEAIGETPSVVRRVLIQSGTDLRARGNGGQNPRTSEAVNMYKKGVKVLEIKETTGVSLVTLNRYLVKLKIPMRIKKQEASLL